MSSLPPDAHNQNKDKDYPENPDTFQIPTEISNLNQGSPDAYTTSQKLNPDDNLQHIDSSNIEETKETTPQSTLPQSYDTLKTFQRVYTLIQFLILGIFILLLMSYWEAKWLENVKWARGKIIWNDEFIKAMNEEILGKIEHKKVMVIPDVEIPEKDRTTSILSYLEKLEIKEIENLPKINYPAIVWFNEVNEFLPLLESGKLPEPGKPEALAGDLVPSDNFIINNIEYKVVGKIKRECAPFVGCYVIPFECLGKIPENAVNGFAFPSFDTSQAYEEIAKILNKQKIDASALSQMSGLQARTSPLFIYGSTLGLIVVCLSISGLLRLYYYRLANPPTPILGPLFSNIFNHYMLFTITNSTFYLVFFLFLFYGIKDPATHREIVYYINHVFSEGELSYIGEAYAQKDIYKATITTFHNNFWVQTFLLTILISIPPFMLGLFKTLISFAFAGFAMAPIWCDTASKLIFHSITIGLELEAYIIAVFGVIMWTFYFWNGIITRKEFIKKIKTGFKVILGATIASGTILAISAFYEAFTLVIFLT